MADDDSKLKQWIVTMMGPMGSVLFKQSTIFETPERLRKSRVDAYRPKMVSIGPLHRGTNPELLYMEEIKWHCMLSLLHRTREPIEKAATCSRAIYIYDDVVRAVYVNDIKFDRDDLARIMFVDGCFLLELLICNDEELDNRFPSRKPGPGAKVRKMELVLSDLKLIENQIPLFIVTLLFDILFIQDSADRYQTAQKVVNGLVLSLFGFSSASRGVENRFFAHFLELKHWFMTRQEDGTETKSNNDISITVESGETDTKPTKLKRCAARLEAAGITIKALSSLESNNEVIMFGCDKSFRKQSEPPMLKIQPLHISDTTEVQWRNFIAWEQNRITHEKFITDGSTRTACNFSEHALLFKDLICCVHDIKLLKKRGVLIIHDTKRTNEDLMTFFREIANKLQIHTNVSSEFVQLINNLNTHSRVSRRGYWFRIFCHSCRSIFMSTKYGWRKMYADLKQNHTATVWQTVGVIAAIVLLFLTIAQTIFGAISL